MDRTWVRGAAFSCAFACGALIVGPGIAGTPTAHAFLGFGPDLLDIFGNDNKSKQHHPHPAADAGAQGSRTMASAAAAEAAPPEAKIGSEPVSASRVSAPASVAATSAPESLGQVSVPESVGRGGAGGGVVPRTIGAGRASNLAPVPSAPVTRNIVIRGLPGSAGTPAPAFVPPALQRAPVTVPLAAPPPTPQLPEGRPAPSGPPAPTPQSPLAKDPGAHSVSGAERIPDSFRVGYAEYLRSASTSDLFVAALPGVAGIAGFTLVGAYAGYRQARALKAALLAPVPTRVLL